MERRKEEKRPRKMLSVFVCWMVTHTFDQSTAIWRYGLAAYGGDATMLGKADNAPFAMAEMRLVGATIDSGRAADRAAELGRR